MKIPHVTLRRQPLRWESDGNSAVEVGTLVALGGGVEEPVVQMQESTVSDVNAAATALARKITLTGKLPVTRNQNR